MDLDLLRRALWTYRNGDEGNNTPAPALTKRPALERAWYLRVRDVRGGKDEENDTITAFVFHVENHPNVTWYHQCVHFGAFSSPTHELAYFFFGMIMMYGLPLLVIIFSYASILGEIYRRSREPGEGFRRSSLGFLGRAKSRTLKMTITIVFVFFVCWTPYYVMCVWHWLFPASAKDVDQRVQRGLFLFACTNSCMNPIVYGAFNIRTRRRTPGQRNQTMDSRHDAVDVVRLVSWRRTASTPAALSGGKRNYCHTCCNRRQSNCVLRLDGVKVMTPQ
ncbi:adipokinetic hormone/corazonin-related peptide receptor variant I-like [Macrosteles quadrilineatus]|uniref:adipokinetic hormone/corazonin-related peptide receptor variant I-like n=1 Tax=Macrosteles quadrilineatus TaxID=74068 RepID=UPI0023E1DC3B|nr:adipokinetic hormone/corazonin-related peptide receptor variant I-like [Macrosteles quadrilineatus]